VHVVLEQVVAAAAGIALGTRPLQQQHYPQQHQFQQQQKQQQVLQTASLTHSLQCTFCCI
jgi:hypothetical protein